MEIINLEDYDISYEIQFIALMITVLEPYITFNIEQEKIYKKGDGILIEEEISITEFIHFIQHTFPDMIQHELKILTEQYEDEKFKKEVYKNYYFKIKGAACETEEYNQYMNMFRRMNSEEQKEKSEYYLPGNYNLLIISPCQEKLNNMILKIDYLKKIRKINRDKNGKIKDVLQFIEGLKYYQ